MLWDWDFYLRKAPDSRWNIGNDIAIQDLHLIEIVSISRHISRRIFFIGIGLSLNFSSCW